MGYHVVLNVNDTSNRSDARLRLTDRQTQHISTYTPRYMPCNGVRVSDNKQLVKFAWLMHKAVLYVFAKSVCGI